MALGAAGAGDAGAGDATGVGEALGVVLGGDAGADDALGGTGASTDGAFAGGGSACAKEESERAALMTGAKTAARARSADQEVRAVDIAEEAWDMTYLRAMSVPRNYLRNFAIFAVQCPGRGAALRTLARGRVSGLRIDSSGRAARTRVEAGDG